LCGVDGASQGAGASTYINDNEWIGSVEFDPPFIKGSRDNGTKEWANFRRREKVAPSAGATRASSAAWLRLDGFTHVETLRPIQCDLQELVEANCA